MRVSFRINGDPVAVDVEPRLHLADCLRDTMKKDLNRRTPTGAPTRAKQSTQEKAPIKQLHRFRVLEVRIHSAPAESLANFRSLSGGRFRESQNPAL
jgi:hypothetical protein